MTIYHCSPHSMRDPLRQLLWPGSFVSIAAVLALKRAAPAEHHSQQDWLETSQGMNSFLAKAEADARLVGRVSRKFQWAEGWWRHLHDGFGVKELDPLREALGKDYLVNRSYERNLKRAT